MLCTPHSAEIQAAQHGQNRDTCFCPHGGQTAPLVFDNFSCMASTHRTSYRRAAMWHMQYALQRLCDRTSTNVRPCPASGDTPVPQLAMKNHYRVAACCLFPIEMTAIINFARFERCLEHFQHHMRFNVWPAFITVVDDRSYLVASLS